MRPTRCAAVLVPVFALTAPPLVTAQTPLTTTRVATGLSLPLYMTAPPGDANRLFIVEQRGMPAANQARVMILDLTTDPDTLLAAPFLVVTGLATGGEQGLLGLAFDPDYMTNGVFYIAFTQVAGSDTRIERYIDTNPLDNVHTHAAGSPTLVLFIDQPFTNHNGGWLGFSPADGYLYYNSGDGGSACDPAERAQDITNQLLGKVLRLDPDGLDDIPGNADDDDFPADPNRHYAVPPSNPFVGIAGDDEIWAYGMRNPWRGSFDRLTGDLYIGDVGQFQREEVDFEPAGDPGGRNYGWDCTEGTRCMVADECCPPTCDGDGIFHGCVCGAAGLRAPIHEYTHALGRCSITGGYVYRGGLIPDLQGTYFFGDYQCNGAAAQIFSFRYDGVTLTDFVTRTTELDPPGAQQINFMTSFGEDDSGEIYISDQSGEIYKIVVNCAGSSLIVSDQPDGANLCVGDDVTFTVATTGQRGAVTYTWQKDGMPIMGAPNAPSYTILGVDAGDAGDYSVVVEDQCNDVTSNDATLTLVPFALGDINADCSIDALDVPLFINVLLGLDLDAGRVARSDVNSSGAANGDDINPFIALLP